MKKNSNFVCTLIGNVFKTLIFLILDKLSVFLKLFLFGINLHVFLKRLKTFMIFA